MSGPDGGVSDAVRILLDCHRRIEASLAVLTRCNESLRGQPLTAEARESILMALACFSETVPQHTADEEETLFPRIRRQQDSRVLPVLARIETLEEEHVCSDRIYPELDALHRIWLTRETLSPSQVSRIGALLSSLRNIYRHHIAVEETEVFPIAAATFSEPTMREVCREMASRRRLS